MKNMHYSMPITKKAKASVAKEMHESAMKEMRESAMKMAHESPMKEYHTSPAKNEGLKKLAEKNEELTYTPIKNMHYGMQRNAPLPGIAKMGHAAPMKNIKTAGGRYIGPKK